MKIKTIEPTPSPNTMKVILNESLPSGTANNYKSDEKNKAPEPITSILAIEGVTGVYHVADFLAIERHPKTDWKTILASVRMVFGDDSDADEGNGHQIDEHFGEVTVQVQEFKGIPMQVKIQSADEEHRTGLSERFIHAVAEATMPDDNVVMERKWKEKRARYGELDEVAKAVAEEIEATYSDERIAELIEYAKNPDVAARSAESKWIKVTTDMFQKEDWKDRFALLEQMNPELEDLEVLDMALHDDNASIRRLAVVYLSMLEDEKVIPYLEKAMSDRSVSVRRTAGDGFSDIGSKSGIPVMIKALQDKSKLVRWRAAMFLYEEGDESAISALKDAEDDPEFEVALQAKMARARIEGGEEAKGSVWKQMTEAFGNE
ncbi:virulence factor [Salisediminibacterium selenitireducens]|uniref:PBS lyase HEAT domain protein repeat-containing protein n=1 Tax=Bacillus selenitireducens (strain ATCC 700615 / DSM 15326 / MLS10) TaxID=439292 RepID=D6XUV1_BACIE|nr:virulence factor [Salisediminibacterium selenitireducens]ADH99587.1 PBS lyase HEAT domain protein repeat-containing protein [[Bacillus] selenitireducens MLS10]